MDKKELKAFSNQAAKGIKSEQDQILHHAFLRFDARPTSSICENKSTT